jgi:hypothetical protein
VKSVLAGLITVQRKTASGRVVDMVVAYFSLQAYFACCAGDKSAEYISCAAVEGSWAGIGRDVVSTWRFHKAAMPGQRLSQVQPSNGFENIARSRSAATVRLNLEFHHWSKESFVELAFGGSSDSDAVLRAFASELDQLGLVIHNDAVMPGSCEYVVLNHAEVWSMGVHPAGQCSLAEIGDADFRNLRLTWDSTLS